LTEKVKTKKEYSKTIKWGEKDLILSTGKLAGQASGSVLARYGDTVVLATATKAPPRVDVDFFPLTVDYEERLYAGGRISTSRFIKREGRPSEEAILTARLIDRSIRPLFPKDFMNEVQVVITILSIDQENDPDIVATVATSAALAISDIPWHGPVGSIRVGYKDGTYLINPTESEQLFSDLDLVVSGTKDGLHMVEAGAKEIPEDVMAKAFAFAHENIQPVIEMVSELAKEAGREKSKYEVEAIEDDLKKKIVDYVKDHAGEELLSPEKASSEGSADIFKEELYKEFEGKTSKAKMAEIFEKTAKELVRKNIIEKNTRPDGRELDEVRPIFIETGILPRTHGSAIFQRGETQVLSVATLGSTTLEQLIDGMKGERTKRYMHHYNFPPFSTGETGRIGSPGRREIGHGALAERAMIPVLPGDDKFPYTIRIVSEVLSSSGSTSMASVCGSTLSLMDAGVPISAPVSGVAMGLVTEGDKWVVLTDIQALEDFYGDMDFKTAGTTKGITAVQMDLKITHITQSQLEKILQQGKEARLFILEKIVDAMPKSRPDLSPYAPRNVNLHIDPSKIGAVIGPGGKMINSIIDQTGTMIDIEDDGTVQISGNDPAGVEAAVEKVKALTHEVKSGEIYDGTVKRIMPFGAFVEILPGKEGLVHISQLANYHVGKVEDEVKLGDKFKVKVIEIDSQGRINLTKKFVEDK
jgi:polyribonucleotide nucleotidyltransferase